MAILEHNNIAFERHINFFSMLSIVFNFPFDKNTLILHILNRIKFSFDIKLSIIEHEWERVKVKNIMKQKAEKQTV